MSVALELKDYFQNKLITQPHLRDFLEESIVVSIELDSSVVYDLMVLIPDAMFAGGFKSRFGECFVVNDQTSRPHVFTRFKSYQWLRQDFERRLAIALWIFGKAVIIRDPYGTFSAILQEHMSLFRQKREDMIMYKYIEFRSDRHNLRQTLHHKDELASAILKANVVKLAAELLILSCGLPYPYKKWLPAEVKKLKGGPHLLDISAQFILSRNSEEVTALSDELVNHVVSLLSHETCFPQSFLNEWWLHLR